MSDEQFTKLCPTCGANMEGNGFSGDVRHRGSIVGVDIGWWNCPACGTHVDDLGNVTTRIEQMHTRARMRWEHPEWFGGEER